jgi:hypothetical protein
MAQIKLLGKTNIQGKTIFETVPQAPAFAPIDISGLQLWLDASDTSTLYNATVGGSLVTTDGSAVARWQDKSGNNRHATQATANARPLLKTAIKNGRNGIRLDGTNDFMDVTSISIAQPYTIFAALVFRNTSPHLGGYLFDKTNGTNRVSIGWNATGLVGDIGKLWYWAGGASLPQDTVNSTNQNIVIGTVFNGASSLMTKNGTQILSGNNGTTSLAAMRLGARFDPSAHCNADLYEILIYNSALTTTQRQAVESYLNTKWALY